MGEIEYLPTNIPEEPKIFLHELGQGKLLPFSKAPKPLTHVSTGPGQFTKSTMDDL